MVQSFTNEALTAAARYFNDGDLEKADFVCRRFLQSEPKNSDALQLLAFIAVNRNKLNEAVELLQRACIYSPNNPELLTNLGNLLKAGGDKAGACQNYKSALAVDERCFAASNNLGLLYFENGDYGAAIDVYQRALDLNPSAEFHFGLSVVYKAAGNKQAAEVNCREAIRLESDYVMAHIHLGNLFYEESEPSSALLAYNQAAQLDPGNVIALNGIGVAQTSLGNYFAAREALEQSVKLNNTLPHTHNNLAMVYLLLGQHDLASAHLKQALNLKPDYFEAWRNYGNVLADQNHYRDALHCYQKAIAIEPAYYEAQLDRAIALKECGESAEAKAVFQEAAQIKPNMIAPLCGFIGASLPNFYWSAIEMTECRQEYIDHLAELENRIKAGLFDPAEAEDGLGLVQPYYLAYQGKADRELNRRYGKLLHKVMAERYPQWSKAKSGKIRQAGQKIRLGIVSRNFNNHSDWKMITSGIVHNLNRDHFELFGYSTGGVSDEITELAEKEMEHFCRGLNFINICNQIEKDSLDILLFPSLGMDHVSFKIACLRLAPIQFCAWGRPDTSGLPTIDYFLSPRVMEPENAQSFYEEKLITLPGVGFYIERQQQPDKVDLQIEGFRTEAIKFLCVQALFKYQPQHDYVFVQLAKKLPNSQFVFVARPDGLASKFIERLQTTFICNGLEPANHLIMLPWLHPGQFAALCGQADVFLDSIGFSGCVTVLDVIGESLPVVTMRGALMCGRQAAGILNTLGLDELIAEDIDEYILKAVQLAKDSIYRQSVRDKILASKTKLYADKSVIRTLEEIFQSAVDSRLTFESKILAQPLLNNLPAC